MNILYYITFTTANTDVEPLCIHKNIYPPVPSCFNIPRARPDACGGMDTSLLHYCGSGSRGGVLENRCLALGSADKEGER